MSSLAHSLVTWTEFQRLPERPENGIRYELHYGEVVIVPAPRPLHVKVQKRIQDLLAPLAGDRVVVPTEFPYRPAPNLQYWVADVACVRREDWDALPPDEWPVCTPALIVEVLSPSNTPAKVSRQRIIAMSAGTEEFWVVDADKRTVQVTGLSGTKLYGEGDTIASAVLGGAIAVAAIFAV